MSNDNKTLADVRPGGRVRLGDQALSTSEGARRYVADFFATQLRRHDFGDYILTELAADFACALAQHLSSQPSPGGQWDDNDLLAALRGVENYLYYGDSNPIHTATVRAAINALAALQPPKQPDSVALAEATEFCIEKGDQQPAGEPVTFQLAGSGPLWCLHVLGMDDVHPAPSKAHAEKAAAWHNEQFKDQAERLGISIEAKVVPWPHSAESHAAGAAEFIPQWLIPQWQLDALEANAKQPAQAVDLGQFRPAVELMEWQERGHAHPDFPEGNPEKHAEALRLLALIDSQAVGNG